jgi:uncharacterized protein (DUF2235 family)
LYINKDGVKKHFMRKTALYLCDTYEEGDQLFQLGFRRQSAIKAAMEEAYIRVMGEFEPKINEMVSNAPAEVSGT